MKTISDPDHYVPLCHVTDHSVMKLYRNANEPTPYFQSPLPLIAGLLNDKLAVCELSLLVIGWLDGLHAWLLLVHDGYGYRTPVTAS